MAFVLAKARMPIATKLASHSNKRILPKLKKNPELELAN